MERCVVGLIFLIAVPIMIVIFLWVNKIHVDYWSLIQRTLPLDTAVFGVYCFCGKQGSGKTYSLTKFILKNHEGRKIYSNVASLRGVEYEQITSVKHLLSLRDEKRVIIIFDEIFTLLNDKTIPRDIRDDLMEFLSQQRKQKNILITTAQEWLNIPIEFRRFVRIQVECSTIPWGRFGGLLIEEYFDAYRMVWSNLDNEYVAPRISKKYSKYEKKYMESYDTYERIRRLKRSDS